MIGRVFNNWTIIKQVRDENNKAYGYICRCICGTEKHIKNIGTVTNGSSTSCGCARINRLKTNNPMFDAEIRDKVSKSIQADPNRKNIINKASKAAQTTDVKNRRFVTNRMRYGGNTPAVCQDVKDKMKSTNIERYGGVAPACNEDVINKSRKTMIEKYGVDNIMKIEEYRKKIGESISNTCREKGIEKLPNGLIAVDECRNMGVLATTFRNWRRDFGAEVAQAKLYGEKLLYRSMLEKKIFDLLSPLSKYGVLVESWNKKAHENMKYKPDIKLTYKDTVIFIDIDGLYWHSIKDNEDEELLKTYHQEKAAEFTKLNIPLIQIREDELRDKSPIIYSMVSHRLGLSEQNFGARKLDIVNINQNESSDFFKNNHLMGVSRGCTCVALKNDNDILCAMSYKVEQYNIDISRFANKINTNIQGGFSRLLSHIIKINPHVKTISNFVDLRYATGNSSIISGFTLEHVHLGFKWTDGKNTYNRYKCQADSKNNLTEKQVAENMGFSKIYDAGQAKFVKIINKNEVLPPTKPTVYLLIGAPGAGKSWVARQLLDDYDYISYDSIPKSRHLECLRMPSVKPKLFDPTIKISTTIRRHSHELDFVVVCIYEDEAVLRDRISSRGGKWTDTILKRNEIVKNRFKKYGKNGFIGTSSQVLEYLKNRISHS